MIRFRVEVQGKREFDRAFNRVSAEITDFRTAWANVRAWLKMRMRRQFEVEGAVSKWAALSPAYREWKQIHYPGKKILVRTGNLKESLTDGNADTIDRETANSFEYGTRLPYSKFHQDGDLNLPQRKIFDFDENDRQRITKEIQRPLVEIVRQQGFEVFEF